VLLLPTDVIPENAERIYVKVTVSTAHIYLLTSNYHLYTVKDDT